MRSPKRKAIQRRSGIRAEEAKRREFKKLFERFRATANTEKAKQLGDELGQMIFG
jgi:hypothetical protein